MRAVYRDYNEVSCHNDLNLWNIARNENNAIAGVFEMRYRDYFSEHVDIIFKAYLKNRGVPLQAPVKEHISTDKRSFVAAIFKIHKRLNKQRSV